MVASCQNKPVRRRASVPPMLESAAFKRPEGRSFERKKFEEESDENECKPTKRTTLDFKIASVAGRTSALWPLKSRSVAPGFGAQCATRVGDYVQTRGAATKAAVAAAAAGKESAAYFSM